MKVNVQKCVCPLVKLVQLKQDNLRLLLVLKFVIQNT